MYIDRAYKFKESGHCCDFAIPQCTFTTTLQRRHNKYFCNGQCFGCGKIIQESEKSSLVTGAKNELYGLDYYNNDYINLRSKYMTKEEITKFDKLINERVSFVTDPQEYLNNRMMRGIAFDQFYEIIADNIIELRERCRAKPIANCTCMGGHAVTGGYVNYVKDGDLCKGKSIAIPGITKTETYAYHTQNAHSTNNKVRPQRMRSVAVINRQIVNGQTPSAASFLPYATMGITMEPHANHTQHAHSTKKKVRPERMRSVAVINREIVTGQTRPAVILPATMGITMEPHANHTQHAHSTNNKVPPLRMQSVAAINYRQIATDWTNSTGCEFTCDPKYYRDGNKCKPHTTCTQYKQQGTTTADAVCCSNKPPTNSDWTNSTGCEFTCDPKYYRDGNKCKPHTTCTQYKQQGTATADAVCCSNKPPTNSDWTNSTGCEFTCDPKYYRDGNKCKPHTTCTQYKQQGTATADAVCCGNKPTDSDWTNSTGCEFTCNDGYYDGTTCKPYTTCTQYKQQGTATADAVCCGNKPKNSDWTNSTGCDYTCEPGYFEEAGTKTCTSCNEYYDIPDNSEYTQGVCAWRCKPGYQYSQTEHKCIVDIPSYVMAPLQTVPQELKDRLNGITFDTTRNGRKINDVPMCKLQRVIEDFQHAKCEKKRVDSTIENR